MKTIFHLLLALTTLTLTGCASVERFRSLMDNQIGKPIAEVQQTFGYNFIERQLDGGDKAYTWYWTHEGLSPGYETATTIYETGSERYRDVTIIPGTYFPPRYYEQNCEFTLIADAAGLIKAWRAHGNGCPSYPGPDTILSSQ